MPNVQPPTRDDTRFLEQIEFAGMVVVSTMQTHEALRLACIIGDIDKVEQMVSGDEIELPDENGRTLLQHASRGGSLASRLRVAATYPRGARTSIKQS